MEIGVLTSKFNNARDVVYSLYLILWEEAHIVAVRKTRRNNRRRIDTFAMFIIVTKMLRIQLYNYILVNK